MFGTRINNLSMFGIRISNPPLKHGKASSIANEFGDTHLCTFAINRSNYYVLHQLQLLT